MAYLALIGGIIFGALGLVAVFSARDTTNKYANWMSWLAWLLFYPAFTLLFFAFEVFWVAGTFALWAGGIALIMTIVGIRWGDRLSNTQLGSIALVIIGLLLFGLSGGYYQ